MNKLIYIPLAFIVAIAANKAVFTVAEYMNEADAAKSENSTLHARVSTLQTALDINKATSAARDAEYQRQAGINADRNAAQDELAHKLNQKQKESRSEIERLKTALRNAGIDDVRIPADVIRMQRERAEAVNQRARDRRAGGHQQASGHTG